MWDAIFLVLSSVRRGVRMRRVGNDLCMSIDV
jgi:hypothetical protein